MEMARILRTARSGRAVRLPAIMRMGENCASCESVIKVGLRKTVSPAFCAGQREEGRKSLTQSSRRKEAQSTQRRARQNVGQREEGRKSLTQSSRRKEAQSTQRRARQNVGQRGEGKIFNPEFAERGAQSAQRRARKTWRRNVRHEFCRSPEEIFRFDEVFNTGVENVVQKRSCDEVNLPLL